MEIVNYCQTLFGCELPSTLLKRQFHKFIAVLIIMPCLTCFFIFDVFG